MSQAESVEYTAAAGPQSGGAASTLAVPATSRSDALFDSLIPPDLRTIDGPESTRNQSRFMVGTLLLTVFIATALMIGRSGQGLAALENYAWAIGVTAAVLLAAFRAGARPTLVANATLGLFYGGSTGLVIASGGKAFGAVMAASLVPVVAYGVRGRRAAILWTGAVFAGILMTAIYAQTTSEFLYDGRLLAWNGWRFPSMGLMVGFVLLSVLGVDWMRERSAGEARELQAQLRSQAERYRDLVENVGDCMMEYDERLRCVYASPNWQELMGRAPQTLLGRGYLDCLHPDDFGDIDGQTDRLRAKPGTTIKYRSRVRHVDGHWIEGEVSARTFYDRNGELRMVTIFRDLGELYRAQLALRHNDRLATAGTLAAGIAHQINNPIGAIRNASEYGLLAARDGDMAELEGVLETNVELAARCGEIVRSLLRFASHEHREKRAQDLRPVIERACDFTESFAGKRGTKVDVATGDAPLTVEVSAIEIEQVIVNLVQNAVEAEPRSGRVEVLARRDAHEVVVDVRDDGRGIAPADLQQIFDPFFTTRLEAGGTGLGLSVALGIAREHDGTLEVESESAQGTRVRLRLPVAPPPEDA